MLAQKNERKVRLQKITCIGLVAIALIMCTVAFADGPQVGEIIKQVINIILNIFLVVGIVLTTFGIGQLFYSFYKDDPDSKQRATTLIVVGVLLISIKAIVSGLNLTQYIPSDFSK